MKYLTTALALSFAALCGSSFAADAPASAAGSTCASQAADKKLAGAAKTSFIKKCEKGTGAAAPAKSACDTQAADKKLAGAAKNSFIKKCTADAAKA